jgi:NAD(P)H-flavin reductase
MTALLTESLAHNPWVAQPAQIVGIRPEVHGVSTYEVVFDNPDTTAAYRFKSGQFNMLYLPGFGESAISISSNPSNHETLSHTVRVAGNVTQALGRMKAGDRIGVRGPFGSNWPVEHCRGRDIVIACGGIGLAPLRPAIYDILNNRSDYGRVILLYGARTPGGLLYASEYDSWRGANIDMEVTVDIGDAQWKGNVGVVPQLFYRHRLQADRTTILSCGPEIMMRFVVFEALARKIRPENIFVSMERNMSCAMGFCGHCQIGPYFVCKDGPVFDYRRAAPFFNVEDF